MTNFLFCCILFFFIWIIPLEDSS